MTAALELLGVSKRFGSLQALSAVDFALKPGQIHALLGENGAGKSTLMKVAFGLLAPDAGTILVDGTPCRFKDPVASRQAGLGMVHQHFTSVPAFTVLENVALAAGWRFHQPRIRSRLAALMERTGFQLDPDAITDDLSAGLKQRLEVLKALAADARVLLLDEPSSVLSPAEAKTFLALVKILRGQGVSSVLITHKLSEALTVADEVTVLRRGRVVHTGPTASETPVRLATFMLGEAPASPPKPAAPTPGGIAIHAERLVVPRLAGSGPGIRDASLTIRAGEIVGVAAIEGNGQRELLRAVAGILRPTGGDLEVLAPVSFVPEDRSTEGMIAEFTLTENVALSLGRTAGWVRGGLVDWDAAAARTEEILGEFGVSAAGARARIRTLSGGNQQRLILAAALERRPKVLVAENPTRGLDIRATLEIHARLAQAADAGVAVLLYLADLDELLELASRIVVLSAGVLTEMSADSGREAIGQRMLAAAAS